MAKAALRDASWYSNPNVTSPKKYHVVVGDFKPACSNGEFVRMFLADFTEIDATQVPNHCRCQRPGCKVRWP